MRPTYDAWCPRCETFCLRVVMSKVNQLGRSRRRRCSNCKYSRLTLETPLIPGLRRALRKLRRERGVQLPLPMEEQTAV